MPSIALKVTRAAAGGEAVAPHPGKPLFRGTGDTDYVCGECGYVIAASMGPTQRVIVDTTICAACGAENEFPTELRG
jgi:DNA-directed RNA polymerase subunit RPC12/RpoP